ncbi:MULTISPECIES: hypothetical protein [unclassified Stappia]|uniref:hypothetical protein n=1 Tax=unclassified Stappia TaxID=2629676 RepID=UPI001643BD01|nr:MULTISPECIES: hypothetical protein [unclassified Stappia]
MTHPAMDDEDRNAEAPLDPAMERVQKKLKRLLAVSSLVMVLGFMAVLAAIIYKLSESGKRADGSDIAATVAIGKDGRVESMILSGDRLILLVRDGTTSKLLHLEATTGRLIGETTFVAQ